MLTPRSALMVALGLGACAGDRLHNEATGLPDLPPGRTCTDTGDIGISRCVSWIARLATSSRLRAWSQASRTKLNPTACPEAELAPAPRRP